MGFESENFAREVFRRRYRRCLTQYLGSMATVFSAQFANRRLDMRVDGALGNADFKGDFRRGEAPAYSFETARLLPAERINSGPHHRLIIFQGPFRRKWILHESEIL